MTYPGGVELEELHALQDAAEYLYERGSEIILYLNSESNITRDKFGSIKKRLNSGQTLHAYPIKYSPSDDELREAGIKENVDVLITLASYTLDNLGITYDNIDTTRDEIDLRGYRYTIKDKNQINNFSHVYLNVVLGLYKK